MSLADKLLQVNQVKQDIKTAIEGKGVGMTGVPFTGYPAKIDSITVGTGMSYHDYAKMLYSMWGFEGKFTEAWTESQNSLEVLFEIPLMLVAPNQNLAGMELDLYVGTDSALTDFYNLVVSGEFDGPTKTIIVNKSLIRSQGDVSSDVGIPFPVYAFGPFLDDSSPAVIDQFFIADLTPLGMGLGIALGKLTGVVIPDNSITIRRGFRNYEAGVIVPEMIEIVGEYAFNSRFSARHCIIGHNVKYIGENGFGNLSHQLPFNIPDSVEWIGGFAFAGHYMNSDIVIPKNVTYIGPDAFLAAYNSSTGTYWYGANVVMHPEIPPVIGGSEYMGEVGPFSSNTEKIYVPDNAVDAYISAWSVYADKIEAVSNMPYYVGYAGNMDGIGTVVELTQAQYNALSVYDDNTYYLIVEK